MEFRSGNREGKKYAKVKERKTKGETNIEV